MQIQPDLETDALKLRRQNRELSILNVIAEALNRSVELDQTLEAALAQVAELLGLKTGWIWLLRENTGENYLAAYQNLPPGLVKNPGLMEGSCYCLDTFRAGDLEGAANVNVVTCSRLKKLVDGTDGLRYHASIPLYAHGKKLGVLNVASADWRQLTHDDLRLLYTIGDLLSIAVERARLFTRSLELGASEERIRLAREIHDTLAQGLAGIALQLETTQALLESDADRSRLTQTIDQALTLTRANLDEARRSVLDLRAAPLENRSLAEALGELVKEQSIKGILKISYHAIGGNHPLPVHIETGIYRIAQEALTNVNLHADATHGQVRFKLSPQKAVLTIADNGRGFDPEHIPPERYGLIGMVERAKLLGATIQIISSPGAGTRIKLVVPLDETTKTRLA
jgi:two-component system NarL family sensor kinase